MMLPRKTNDIPHSAPLHVGPAFRHAAVKGCQTTDIKLNKNPVNSGDIAPEISLIPYGTSLIPAIINNHIFLQRNALSHSLSSDLIAERTFRQSSFAVPMGHSNTATHVIPVTKGGGSGARSAIEKVPSDFPTTAVLKRNTCIGRHHSSVPIHHRNSSIAEITTIATMARRPALSMRRVMG